MATLFTSELEEGMVTLTDTYSNSGKLIVYGAYEEYHPDAFWQ